MKKNKVKHLITICLILAIAIFMIAGTYSRYSTSGQGTTNAQLAKWAVAITTDNGNTDLTQEETQDITFVLDTNENVVNGKIAPGSSATAEVELDLTGTEVAVDFTATIDQSQISNLASYDKMTLTTKLGDKTLTSGVPQLINLENDSAFTAANGKKIVTLKLEWTNDNENNADDTTMGTAGGTLTIPVRFEAKQHIVTDAVITLNNITNIREALANVNEGGTVTVADNLDLTEYTRIDASTPGNMINFPENATLDLNGKTITNRNFAFSYQGDNLTIQNGNFVATIIGDTPTSYETTGKGSYGLFLWDNNNTSHGVTLKNIKSEGGINAYNAYDIVLEDCTINATNYYAVYGNAKTSFTIKSGTYTAGEKALFGYIKTEDGESNVSDGFKIYGGTFITNDKPFCLNGSNNYTPIVYGGNFDKDVSSYCADGYECNYDDVSGMWVVTVAE